MNYITVNLSNPIYKLEITLAYYVSLACKVPWTEEPGGLQKDSGITQCERLSMRNSVSRPFYIITVSVDWIFNPPYIHFFFSTPCLGHTPYSSKLDCFLKSLCFCHLSFQSTLYSQAKVLFRSDQLLSRVRLFATP